MKLIMFLGIIIICNQCSFQENINPKSDVRGEITKIKLGNYSKRLHSEGVNIFVELKITNYSSQPYLLCDLERDQFFFEYGNNLESGEGSYMELVPPNESKLIRFNRAINLAREDIIPNKYLNSNVIYKKLSSCKKSDILSRYYNVDKLTVKDTAGIKLINSLTFYSTDKTIKMIDEKIVMSNK